MPTKMGQLAIVREESTDTILHFSLRIERASECISGSISLAFFKRRLFVDGAERAKETFTDRMRNYDFWRNIECLDG